MPKLDNLISYFNDEYIKRWDAIDGVSADALDRYMDSVMTDVSSRYHRSAQRVIASIPFIQIVHCKDCKYSDKYCHCSLVNFWTNETDFCSRGIRKENINEDSGS